MDSYTGCECPHTLPIEHSGCVRKACQNQPSVISRSSTPPSPPPLPYPPAPPPLPTHPALPAPSPLPAPTDRVLHLEGNCLTGTEGIGHLLELRALYLNNNDIQVGAGQGMP